MWGFGLLRSPPLLLLLPQLGLGLAASRSQAGTMDLGGCGSARSSPAAEGRPRCLQLSAVPGSDPQRSNELLLLAAEGPERRDLSGDRAPEEPQPSPQHHVVYFPGDVQVTGLLAPALPLGPLLGPVPAPPSPERGVALHLLHGIPDPGGRCPWRASSQSRLQGSRI